MFELRLISIGVFNDVSKFEAIDEKSIEDKSVGEEPMDAESVNVESMIEIFECIDEGSIDVESIEVDEIKSIDGFDLKSVSVVKFFDEKVKSIVAAGNICEVDIRSEFFEMIDGVLMIGEVMIVVLMYIFEFDAE